MQERDGYIPGVPCWVDTGQPDPEAAVGFYGDLFGWEFEDRMPRRIGAAGQAKGAQLVNEPGTWNFSGLNTRDPEGSKAFYGTVFGWEASGFEAGNGGGSSVWRLPGYGDFLEQSDPDLRKFTPPTQSA